MGKISDLLKSAFAGRSDTLAKWREAVSLAIDGDQVGTGTGLITVALSAPTAALDASTPTNVAFDAVKLAENAAVAPAPIGTEEILYTAATGVFTLTPGLYDLAAYLVGTTFATDATDHLAWNWAVAATGVPLYTNMPGDAYPGASTVDATSQSVCRVLHRVAAGANVNVAVAATALVGATTVVGANSYAVIRKLS